MKLFSRVDKGFLIGVILLLIFGLFIFASAALGVLTSNEVKFYSVLESQFVFALLIGVMALCAGMLIPFTFYEKHAFKIFIITLVATMLVFVPGLQLFHGGAHRWIHIGSLSFQPSELLKFGSIGIVAMWCTAFSHRFKKINVGFMPYMLLVGLISIVMLLQPDFGTLLIIILSTFTVYFVGGSTIKHIGFLVGAGFLGFIILVSARPYMMERIHTFFNSSHDVHGSSWQLNQSLIAIGSGGVFGRGYGQSVQKFNYLPEPIGDSIFAVLAEELGLLGVGILFVLYGIVIIRGLMIALFSESQFGRLLVLGIIALLVSQILLNIGSMLGLLPLTGVPLPFISHGGTALMVLLFEIGVVLNVSRQSHFV